MADLRVGPFFTPKRALLSGPVGGVSSKCLTFREWIGILSKIGVPKPPSGTYRHRSVDSTHPNAIFLRSRAAADRVACEARRTERDLLSVVVTEAGNGLAEGDFGGQARLFQSAARAAVLLGWAGVRYGKESYCAQVRVGGNQAGPLGF